MVTVYKVLKVTETKQGVPRDSVPYRTQSAINGNVVEGEGYTAICYITPGKNSQTIFALLEVCRNYSIFKNTILFNPQQIINS